MEKFKENAISEIGEAKQIRVMWDDIEYLEKLKEFPQEPWYKVVHRVLVEHKKLKKV